MFANKFNVLITVNSVAINETSDEMNIPCNGTIIGNRNIEPDKNFGVAFSCPNKEAGEAYVLIVTINYTCTVDGKTKDLIDRGYIKGQGGY